jgi:hypothetical protein
LNPEGAPLVLGLVQVLVLMLMQVQVQVLAMGVPPRLFRLVAVSGGSTPAALRTQLLNVAGKEGPCASAGWTLTC